MLRRHAIFTLSITLVASTAAARVTTTAHGALKVPKAEDAAKGLKANSVNLIDSSGLEWEINTSATAAGSLTSASGSANDATFTASGVLTSSMGGSSTTAASDAFDDYTGLQVNGTNYDGNGAATLLGRELTFPTKTIGAFDVSRRVMVPSGDNFARWINIITNTTGAAAVASVRIEGNMGSDSNTNIRASSLLGPITPATEWVVTDDRDDLEDPKICHVVQGAGAPLAPTHVVFQNGDDIVFFTYEVPIPAGGTAVILNFASGHFTKNDAVAKCRELVTLPVAATAGMTASELAAVRNFPVGAVVPTLTEWAAAALAFGLLGMGAFVLRRRAAGSTVS